MRGAPLLTSMPTRPSSKPTSTMATAFSGAPCASTTAPVRPSTIRLKYSAALNLSASHVIGALAVAITIVAMVPAIKRSDGGDRERGAGAALLGHLMPVETRHDGGGFARHIDQDGRGRAAILRAVENAREHDERRRRLQGKCERQQNGDGRDRRNAGKNADQRADERAKKTKSEIGRRECDGKAGGQICEEIHPRALTTTRSRQADRAP